MKRAVALAVAAALMLPLAACGGSGKPASPGSRGTVVLVTHDAFAVSNDVLRAFERERGYRVRILKSGDAGRLVNQAVLTAGKPVADALFGVDNTFLGRALEGGVFVAHRAKGIERVPERFRLDPTDRVTPIDYGDVCLNYDRSYFRGDRRPPATLDDLARPEYRGLTVVEDPALSSPGLAFLLTTVARYGAGGWKEYWQRLKDNDVKVAPDWDTAYGAEFSAGGGKGRRPIVVSYASSPPADIVYASAPKTEPSIGVVDDGCFRQVEFAGVLRGARNVAGARALVDFMVTRRFQQDLPLSMFVFPVRPDVILPTVFRRWAARPAHPVEMSPATIDAHRSQWIEEWADLMQ
jgi:thiamine transport system substrate-binding protein